MFTYGIIVILLPMVSDGANIYSLSSIHADGQYQMILVM